MLVLCTGGFDPIHSGHIEYLNAASKMGDTLVVGLNSDEWLIRKKGKAFMPWAERKCILEALRCVDSVIDFDDSDGTAKDAINKVKPDMNFFALVLSVNAALAKLVFVLPGQISVTFTLDPLTSNLKL